MPDSSRAPRSRRKPPSYCLHKASGLAYVKIRGQRHYLGRHGTDASWAKYQETIRDVWASALVAAVPEATVAAARHGRYRIVQLCKDYRRFALGEFTRDGKPTSSLAIIRRAMRLLRQQFGKQLAAEFGPLKLKALRQTWVDRGLARKTIALYTNAVRAAFYWAVENELLTGDRGYALWKVKPLGKGKARDPEPIAPVEDELVEATLPFLPKTVADMIRLQRLTGMRPGEVCSMTRQEVKRLAPQPRKKARANTRALFPDVPTSPEELDVWEFHPKRHKMSHRGRPRVVMIRPAAVPILRPYLASAGEGRCFPYTAAGYRRAIARACERAFKIPEGLTTAALRRAGRAITHHPLVERKLAANGHLKRAQAVREACGEDAELRTAAVALDKLRAEARAWRAEHVWHPNQLRHAYATEVSSKFGDIDAARVLLGHSAKSTTEIYAERDLAKARDIARQLG